MTRTRLALVLPLCLVAAYGCRSGNPNAPAKVSGTVTIDGAPLNGGTVTFHSKDAGRYSAVIQAGGHYSAVDVPTGEMAITVETESVNPNPKMAQYGGAKYAGKGQMGMKAPPGVSVGGAGMEYRKIPAKYNSPQQSGLSVTLERGSNTKDIPLIDKE